MKVSELLEAYLDSIEPKEGFTYNLVLIRPWYWSEWASSDGICSPTEWLLWAKRLGKGETQVKHWEVRINNKYDIELVVEVEE